MVWWGCGDFNFQYQLTMSIPKNWKFVALRELVTQGKQRNPSKRPAETFRYVDVSAVDNTQFKITDSALLTGAEAPSRARKEILADDVMFATVRPTLKRIAFVPKEHDGDIASTGFAVLRAKKEMLDARFLFFSLLLESFIKRMGELQRGASYPAIRESDLWNEIILVPPLSEQRAIAEILGCVKLAIEQQQRLLALTAELKKALMHKLFTEGLRGEPQKETEIGLVPSGWEVVEIGSLGKVVTGSTPKTSVADYYDPPEIDFISPGDLGITKTIYDSENKISQSGLVAIRSLPKSAIMCVCIGSSIGKVGMTSRENSATNQQINAIIANEKHDPTFIYYLLTYFNQYWRGFATFGPVPILSKSKFAGISIVVPANRADELVIADRLSALDERAEFAMKRIRLLTSLFRTLLHQLMTAKVRVGGVGQ